MFANNRVRAKDSGKFFITHDHYLHPNKAYK